VSKWVAPGGFDVELITLDGVECLRVRRFRFLQGRGYYRTIDEVQELLEAAGLTMADLVPVLPTVARPVPRG
jgi:hypothetical protein